MKEPTVVLSLSETEFELILAFMKLGLEVNKKMDINMYFPEGSEEAYERQAEELYDKLTDTAKFEFLVRRLSNGDYGED